MEALLERARSAGPGDEGRRARMLADFAVEGHLGQATKDLDAALAQREAELSLELDGEEPIGFREAAVMQANEPDGVRRARIEAARLAAIEEHLNPLLAEVLERSHALAADLGWDSYAHMCAECKGIDLVALERQTSAFARATGDAYAEAIAPEVRRALDSGLDGLRRSDLTWVWRWPEADALFPAERLVESFRATMAGLGIDLDAQANVALDVERRPRKSPRAFCVPVRVPDEVYLVVPPIGGRDDYNALLHEGGHTEHYATVDPALPWEFRALGDNSVTEAFAFLFDRLVEDPEWLRRHLGVEDPEPVAAHARAQWLYYTRRFGAKLAYELELHGGDRPLDRLAETYAQRLTDAVRVPWPTQTFLEDVDPGFYAASYLRAWALETHLRALLRERFGPAWFDEPAAGELLRGLWSQGQRLPADELLGELTGAQLDFGAMLADLGA